MLSSVSRILFGTEYPREALNGAWIKLLRNQFHDIIPGSSIEAVYRDSDREYAEIRETVSKIERAELLRLATSIESDGGILVYNPTPFAFSGVIDTELGARYVENIPAHGYKVTAPQRCATAFAGDRVIENELVRVTFDEAYEISSFYDKRAGREIASADDRLGILEVFEDIPFCYDAWEIAPYYTQKRWRVDSVDSVETVNLGERAGYRITRSYGNSTVTQTVTLSHGSARLDFYTEVDWNEEHSMMKATFPLAVHTARATYDIQFGNLERPTHRNTAPDEAMFEVCAHKWADISERDYGVSLLNDSKYGYSCDENRLSLTLLRSPTFPDPTADKGRHTFTYSLLPHIGALGSETVIEGYRLNDTPTATLISKSGGALPAELSFVSSDAPAFVVETFKAAEDGDGYIVRGYESLGTRVGATLTFARAVKDVAICDLMERDIASLPSDANSVRIDAKPFEIVSVRVRF